MGVVTYWCCWIVSLLALSQANIYNFTQQIGDDTRVSKVISEDQIHVYTFSTVVGNQPNLKPDDVITIDMEVTGKAMQNLAIAHPLRVSAFSPQSSIAWTLPYYVSALPIFKIRKVLCPLEFKEPIEGFAEPQITVALTTDSGAKINYTMQAKIFGSGTFDVGVDDPHYTKGKVSVREPQFYQTEFRGDTETIEIEVGSKEQQLCGLVLIQNHSCPFIDTPNEASMAAMKTTFLSKSTLLLRKSKFGPSVYIVFMLYPDDTPCGLGKRKGKDPSTLVNEAKSFELRVLKGPSVKDYLLPTVLLFGVIIIVYVATGVFLFRWRATESRYNVGVTDSASVSSDGSVELKDRLVSPSVDDNLIDLAPDEVLGSSNPVFALDTQTVDSGASCSSADHSSEPKTETVTSKSCKRRKKKSKKQQPDPESAYGSESDEDDCIFDYVGGGKVQMMDQVEGIHTSGSKRYGWFEVVIGLFFLLPVLQIMTTLWQWRDETGDADVCYHNFGCARPLFPFRAFNRVYSNLPYILLGTLFLVIVYVRKQVRGEGVKLGTMPHSGMQTALGFGLIAEGIISAVYDVCPHNMFLQFDASFMFMLISMSLFKLYSARHGATDPAIFYALMAILLGTSLIETLSKQKDILHYIFIALQLVVMPLLSFQLYYGGQLPAGKNFSLTNPRAAFNFLKNMVAKEGKHSDKHSAFRPLFKSRLLMLGLGNLLNIVCSTSLQGILPANGTRYLLCMMILYWIFYLFYYTVNKFFVGEKLQISTWVSGVGAMLFWFLAIVCLMFPVTDWTMSPAQSRAMNEPCRVFNFYDIHDLWHMSSAAALFLSLTLLTTIDDDLRHKSRDQITVF